MSAVKVVGQNDIGTVLKFTVRDTNGNVVDLTGATATISLLVQMSPTVPQHSTPMLKVLPATIFDAVNGVISYTTNGTEFSYGNVKYMLQVTVTFPNGNVFNSSYVEVFCRPVLNNPNSGGVYGW